MLGAKAALPVERGRCVSSVLGPGGETSDVMRCDRSGEGSPMADRRTITYQFAFPDGETKEFSVELEVRTLNFVGPVDPAPPPWTDLCYSQCSN